MRLLILCGVLAMGVPFAISAIAQRYGLAVSGRFLERPYGPGGTFVIPCESSEKLPDAARETDKSCRSVPLNAESLVAWVSGQSTSANGYATRVMPLDFIYLIAAGGFLALSSLSLARIIVWPDNLVIASIYWWCALPLIYLVSDLIEDGLIATLLLRPATISDSTMAILGAFRRSKIWSMIASFAQLVPLVILSFVWAKP